MKEPQFVNANELKTLEQYGASLLTSMASLRTLEKYQLVALKIGILDEVEMDRAANICKQIKNLLEFYQTQVHNIMDRTNINEDEVIRSFRETMPNIPIPRKRKNIKNKKEENSNAENI